MKVTLQEQKQAERLLQHNSIWLHDIESFSFMKRYRQISPKGNLTQKEKYGAGILTLRLKNGTEKAIYLPPFRHPSAMVHYLLSEEVPFKNYVQRERVIGITIPEKKYCHSSLYMLYFVSLFVVFSILGYKMVVSSVAWGIISGVIFLGLGAFILYALLTRFGYLTLDNGSITIHSLGRKVRYPYSSLRKVNFDYARERTFTYNMEVLDDDYNYHLYYIGRVPHRKLEEITEYLRHAGIDTSCYIEQDKRFYQDYNNKF